MTYWSGNGKYEKEYKILWDKYVPSSGIRLTAYPKVNRVLIRFVRAASKYYRFYNDGEPYGKMQGVRKAVMGGHITEYYTPENEKMLEERMDKIILSTWEATKHATLPVVDEIENYDDYDVIESGGKVSYMPVHQRHRFNPKMVRVERK
jgi:hypothetical protein